MAPDDLTCRHDIDALVFRPSGPKGGCFIHRLAFRSLSGNRSQESGEANFRANRDAFERAAAKIKQASVPAEQNFHVASRDVRRALATAAGVWMNKSRHKPVIEGP